MTGSPEFYGMVGRVAMLATLVEDKLLSLVWTLDQGNVQELHAGKMSSALLRLIRRFLVDLPSIQVRGSDLLERTEGALGRRNEIVHSLLPKPGDVKAFRHRPLPKNKREFENVWMDAVEIEISDI